MGFKFGLNFGFELNLNWKFQIDITIRLSLIKHLSSPNSESVYCLHFQTFFIKIESSIKIFTDLHTIFQWVEMSIGIFQN